MQSTICSLLCSDASTHQNEESEEKTLENEPSVSTSAAAGQHPRRHVPNSRPTAAVLKPMVNHAPAATSSVVSNHISSSATAAAPTSTTTAAAAAPTSNSTNSNWSCDSWADGEFEPLEEDTFVGKCYENLSLIIDIARKCSFIQFPSIDHYQ